MNYERLSLERELKQITLKNIDLIESVDFVSPLTSPNQTPRWSKKYSIHDSKHSLLGNANTVKPRMLSLHD